MANYFYRVSDENVVKITTHMQVLYVQPNYPDGTEWTYEEAEAWGIAKVAFLEDPENNEDAPFSPKNT